MIENNAVISLTPPQSLTTRYVHHTHECHIGEYVRSMNQRSAWLKIMSKIDLC